MKMHKNWNFSTKYFAHRGGGILWPENTLEAIKVGKQYGFKAVEFDVMLSGDKVPFLMHDDVLGRTIVDSKYINKSFHELNSQEIINIDVGSWFDKSNPDLSSIHIPKFEDVLKYCTTNDMYMNIEIKPVPGYEVITGQVVAAMTSTYFPADCKMSLPLFSSFSYEALEEAKSIAPYIPRGYLIDNIHQLPDWKERCQQLDVVSVHTNHKNLDESLIHEIKSLGYKVFCYTVNDFDTAQTLLSLGMDAFCTDKLDVFSSQC